MRFPVPDRARRQTAWRSIASICIVASVVLLARPVSALARPNVVLIIADDQRAPSTLKVMPRTKRWLVRDGRRFTQAFATTPLCCPSRSSIFTGRYAHNHGVLGNGEAPELEHSTTIQRYLQRTGYRTAIFGKFLNKWNLSHPPPYFSDWAIFRNSRYSFYNSRWNVGGGIRTIHRYSTNFVADRGIRFLNITERQDRRRWFLVLSPPAPHLPATPHPQFADATLTRWKRTPAMQEKDRSDKPPFVRRSHPYRLRHLLRVRNRQLRSLMSVDLVVGRVLEQLSKLNESKNTLVIYLSDNGFQWGEHGLGTSVTWKGPPYTPSVKIPMLMRWPGHVRAPSRDARLAANIDVAPTIAQAASMGSFATGGMDGRSLLRRGSRSRLLLEHWHSQGPTPPWASIRTRSFQYIEYYAADGVTPRFREYYDLRRDPWQLRNTLADGNLLNDPQVSALSAVLRRDRLCRGSLCP